MRCVVTVTDTGPDTSLVDAGLLNNQADESSSVLIEGQTCFLTDAAGSILLPPLEPNQAVHGQLPLIGLSLPLGWTANLGMQCEWPTPVETFSQVDPLVVRSPIAAWAVRAWSVGASTGALQVQVVPEGMRAGKASPSQWLHTWRRP